MEFKIGDRVVILDIGDEGTVTDVLRSEARAENLYVVKPEKGGRSVTRAEEDLEMACAEPAYEINATIEDGVVVVSVFRDDGARRIEVTRGHGHILREGDVGVAQALSYAARRAFIKIEPNFVKGD